MKICLGDVPVKALNVNKFEMNTNDATILASDMQSGLTAYARGKKVTGTGKAFSFAMYGGFSSNVSVPIPVSTVNTVCISCAEYGVQMAMPIQDLRSADYSAAQTVATVTINGTGYPINVKVASGSLTISCDKTVTLEVMFGKDDHV